MWSVKKLRGSPTVTFEDGGGIVFMDLDRTWHAVLCERVSVPRFATVKLTAVLSAHPAGDTPMNVHSRGWVGIGPNGEDNPLASGVNTVSMPLDWRGLTQEVSTQAVALVEEIGIFVGLELGVNDMWPIHHLEGRVHSTGWVMAGAPAPVPAGDGIAVGEIVERDGFVFITLRLPKVK